MPKYFNALQFAVNVLTSIRLNSPKEIEEDLAGVWGELSSIYTPNYSEVVTLLNESQSGADINKLVAIYRYKNPNTPFFLDWGDAEINAVMQEILAASPIHKNLIDKLHGLNRDCVPLDIGLLGGSITDVEGLRDFYLEKRQELMSIWGLDNTSTRATGGAPEVLRLPRELDTDRARKYFDKARELGIIDNNFKWLKGLQLLACFAREMSLRLELGKGCNSDYTPRISWKPFEELFQVERGKLRSNYSDIQKTGVQPNDSAIIDQIFN